MNTVRITLFPGELEEVLAFLDHYATANQPSAVRLARRHNEHENMVAQLIPTLCTRLSLRLATARLSLKDQYRMHLPGELALALVLAWMEQGGSGRWPLAQVLIGNVHRNLQ